MQSIDETKITKGINGDLCQELRELELLDHIAELLHKKELPKHVTGCTRNELIYTYRKWKGDNYVPPYTPVELAWSSVNMLSMQSTYMEDNKYC